MRKEFYYLTFFFFSLTACNNVEGTYVANHNDGKDTLIINSDNFIRKYYPEGKTQPSIDTGNWSLKGHEIIFDDWRNRSEVIDRSSNGKAINYGTDVDFSYFGGETKIWLNYDLEYYYLKE